jgi:hypothetical protein
VTGTEGVDEELVFREGGGGARKLQRAGLGTACFRKGKKLLRAGLDVADEDGGAVLFPEDFRRRKAVGRGVKEFVEDVFEVGDGGEDFAGKVGAALIGRDGCGGHDFTLAAQDTVLAGLERRADLPVLLFQITIEGVGGGGVGEHQAPGGRGVVSAAEGDGVGADGGQDIGGDQFVGDGVFRKRLGLRHKSSEPGCGSSGLLVKVPRRLRLAAPRSLLARPAERCARGVCSKTAGGVSTVFAVFAVFAVVYFFEALFGAENEHGKPQKPQTPQAGRRALGSLDSERRGD